MSRKSLSGKSTIKRELSTDEFVGNNYPQHLCSNITRHSLKTTRSGSKTNVSYDSKMNEECFICRKDENEPLIACEGKHTFSGRACKTKFHLKCIMKYNHGGFLFRYSALPECQNKLLCPLHCCHVCNSSGYRQSAYNGLLIECTDCFRSFHETCIPCGAAEYDVENSKNKYRMISCPSHASSSGSPNESNQSTSEKFPSSITQCHLCESELQNTIKCIKCPRVFHRGCIKIKKLDGTAINVNICNHCLQNNVIRINQPILVKVQKKFLFGITRPWDMCLEKSSELYKKHGFCVVEHVMERGKKLSIHPVSDLVHMTEAYLKMAPTAKDRNAWKTAMSDFDKRKEFPTLYKSAAKEVATSFFYDKDNRFVNKIKNEGFCSCSGSKRCSTNDCDNFSNGLECPSFCNDEGTCHNRNISELKQHPNFERREAGVKGYGLFATGPIKNSDFLMEYVGEIISKEEKERRAQPGILSGDRETNHYLMQARGGSFIDCSRFSNLSRYFNHSCDPNCESLPIQVMRKNASRNAATLEYEPALYFRAIKNIAKDEELTIDYGMDNSKMNCRCGSHNCTGRFNRKQNDENGESEEPPKKMRRRQSKSASRKK